LPYPPVKKSLLADIFLGRQKNPQYLNGRVDAKMWLYLVGAVMLELHVLSFVAHHYLNFGLEEVNGIYLCAVMITFFVFDYLSNEEVHLYTYDLFAERLGFKLGWGCLVFYPYFYAIALWSSVELLSPELATWQIILFSAIFVAGWMLARGANMQKFYFKTQPNSSFLGIYPETLSENGKSLLVNGFWGLSRHINYLGEVLMAAGIAITVTAEAGFWPWLYPLYYIALLFPRQIDDDKRCALKYGAL
jgi:delta14-sterol reductase